jgi:Fic family protein
MEMVDAAIRSTEKFSLRPSHLLTLQRIATEGVEVNPGRFRQEKVTIHGSKHIPPPWEDVPRLVEDICDYVNKNWNKTPIHLASYLMWRINWVHPFCNGNGRTSRMISYLILCIRLGFKLPGARTIPEQISSNKTPYYDALEAADASEMATKLDLSAMEGLLSGLLATQLVHLHDGATGQCHSLSSSATNSSISQT